MTEKDDIDALLNSGELKSGYTPTFFKYEDGVLMVKPHGEPWRRGDEEEHYAAGAVFGNTLMQKMSDDSLESTEETDSDG